MLASNHILALLGLSMRHLYYFLVIALVFLAVVLFFCRRIRLESTSSLPTYNKQPLQDITTLKPSWPPSNLVTLAPETANLPTPTIRRHSYPVSENAFANVPPMAKVSYVDSWPATGNLVRRETTEEVNGCRRHAVVFGRRS